MKRLFDLIFSFFGLIFLLPVFVIIMVLFITLSPGPIFYRQDRVGQFGKLFKILKFRTMNTNSGGTISIMGQDRITKLGVFLRKYKLDELPELWNVLLGEMSFVGPRPDVSDYMDRLTGEQKKILTMRPGITCPASLKYSNEEELLARVNNPLKYYDEIIWPEKVNLNMQYYYDRGFFYDLKIIFLSVFYRK